MLYNYEEYCLLLINFSIEDEICGYLKNLRINILLAENLSEVTQSEIDKSCVILLNYSREFIVINSFLEFLRKTHSSEKLLVFAELQDIYELQVKYPEIDFLLKDKHYCPTNFKKLLDKLEICKYKQKICDLENEAKNILEKAELYRTILNSTPEPIIMIDEEGHILGSNDYVDTIMIKKIDSYLGQNLYDLVSIGLSSLLKVYVKKAKITQMPVNFTFRHYDFVIEYTIVPITDKEGNCNFIIFRDDQTERDFAEKALHFNVDLLTKILNNLPVMVWHLNHNFVIKLILGRIETVELLNNIQVGEQIGTFLENYPNFFKNILEAAQNKTSYSIENIDGKFVENFYSVEFDATKKFSSLTIVSNDVTDKIQTEIKLEEERLKLRYAFSLSYDLFWEFDLNSNLIKIHKLDEGKEETFPPNLLTSDEFIQYVCDEDKPYLRKLYVSFKKGLIQNIDFYMKVRDFEGNELWFDNKVSVFELDDKTKRPKRLIGVSRNVTDIVKVENEIQKYRNLLESIINSGNIFYLVLDSEMKVVSYNKNAFDLLLSTMNIYLRQGADFKEFLKDTELSNRFQDAFYKTLKGSEVQFEFNYVDYVGSDFWFEHTFSPIFSLEGEVLYVNIMARPINERKESERKRQEAIVMVENAARIASIGIIAGGITHELSQPLNAIKIAADGILFWNKQNNMMLPEQIARLINRIGNAVLKIEDIIQHMRSYWLNAANIEKMEVKVSDVINRGLSLILQKLQAHNIYLKIEEEIPNLTIRINPLQLEIVINNLIINAIQAIDEKKEGERVIIIRSGIEKDVTFISVSDSGIGLPENVSQEKLFEPFFSTKKEGKGTGLGLAIVKTLLDRVGARILAFNNEMGGATFKIYF